MSAASQARKRRGADDLEIVAFERGRATSYSACGIPYWVGGAVDQESDLVSRTPEQHRANGELAYHVLDVMESLLVSASTGTAAKIASRAERPAPVPLTEVAPPVG